MKEKKSQLTVEKLEDRIQPSTTGLPWEYGNLTLSFAPDGTKVDGYQSSLFQTLGSSQAASKAWEAQVLKAAQTWAAATNINIGLVADGGQALGVAGLAQGDARFGDIRVAAEPMGLTGPLGIGSPYNPVAGTRSGDIVFNSSLAWGIGSPTANDVYTVALHEIGNALGLSENADPFSAMAQTYQGARTDLSQNDVTAIQALYGTPTPDAYQGATGNATFATAAVMKLPEIAADINTVNSAEYFRYTTPSYADRTITVTVQTAGISLITPRISVYTATGQLISTSSAPDAFSGKASITLNNVKRGTVLYFKVDSPASDVFGMGGYRLKVDSGSVSQKQIAAIDTALNGTTIQYTNFAHSTSTITTAASLDQVMYQIDPRFDYAINAKLGDASDVDFFSIVTPANAPQALIFTAAAGRGSKLSPELTVYDANGNEVDAQILSNDSTGYVVQVLNPVANARYYVAVSPDAFAASINDKGTYVLGVNYAATPIVLQTIVDDTLSANDTIDVASLQSSQVQLYHFVLSVDTGGAATDVVVVMELFDANNNLVLALACQDGNTVSANVQMNRGGYTVRFIGLSKSGAVIPDTAYSLLGVSLSAPLDPIPVNPTDPTLIPTQPLIPPTVVVTTPVTPPILPPVDPSLVTNLLTGLLGL
jgi:Matrixin